MARDSGFFLRRGTIDEDLQLHSSLCLCKNFSQSTYAFVINDFYDCCQASAVWSMGEKDDTSNLDEPPFGGFDTDICHSGDAKIDWFNVGKTGRLRCLPTRLARMLMLLINLLSPN